MPYFEELYQVYGDRIDFMMVDLTDGSRETVDSASAFIEENSYSFPVYYDTEGKGVNAYGIMSIPTTVFITKEGNVYSVQNGGFTKDGLEGMIERFLEHPENAE